MKFITEKTKKIHIFLFLLCLTASIGTIKAQRTVPPGTYLGNSTFYTQADVDAFVTTLGNNTRIQGSILIDEAGGTDPITDLSVFKNLTHISGNLTIWNIRDLTVLSHEVPGESGTYAFGALEEVSGFALGKSDRSVSLTSLGRFPSLTRVLSLSINNCDELLSIDAETFPALETTTGSIFSGEIRITNNAKLSTIADFSALTTTGGDLQIRDNTELSTIVGFSVLTRIGRDLIINSHDELTNAGDYPKLTTIGEDLIIAGRGNDMLASLGDFTALTSIGGDLTIQNNDILGDCCGIYFLAFTSVAERGGTITLNNNAAGCNATGTNAEKAAEFTAVCYPPTLSLSGTRVTDPAGEGETNYTSNAVVAGSTLTVNVAIGGSATGWSAAATADTDSIITLPDPANSMNDDTTLAITIAANAVVETRTATITFTSTGGAGDPATQTLVITQAAAARTIAFSSNSLSSDTAAGTKDVTITSNSEWRVTTSDVLVTSLTFTPVSGSSVSATPSGGNITLDATGDGTLVVAYSENVTPAERTGTLTLSARNGATVLTTNPTPVTTTLTQAVAARAIAFSSNSLSADVAAGTKDVTITSNSDWQVTTSDVLVTSLTFTPTTGNNTTATPSGGNITLDATGDGTLAVAYSENGTPVERTGTLTLSALDGSSNVLTTNPSPVTTTLTQAAAARSIAFSSSSLSADTAAGTKDVTITSNSDWRVTTSDVLVTSLTFTPTTGNNTTATPSGGSITLDATGDGTLAVAYSENGTPAERTGTLTLSAKNGENVLTTNPSPVTTTLTQAAAARSIAFSSSSLSADAAAGTKDVTITSNSDWRVTTSDVLVTSLTFTPTTGNNTTATPSGGSITLDATGDGTLAVAYSENGTPAERTGTLTLSSLDGSSNVLTTNPSPVTTTLTQAAAARSIAFSSSSLSADTAAGTKDVTITSNSDWRVTTSDVLVTSLTFTPTTGNNTTATPSGGSITLDATGDGTLSVAYSANDTIVERTGTLTLSALDGSSNVLTTNPSPVTTTLTQAAAARSIAFSSNSLSADTAAGTKDVTITSNSDWQVTTSDVLVTSLTFTPTTGNNTTATPSGGSITLDATGDGTLSVAYSANDTIVERTGTLTLSALDGSSNVLTTNPSPVTTTLTQAAAARSIAFSSNSLSADAAAGTKDVTITSNSDWRVTTSDVLVTSLTFTPTTGNNTTATPSGGSITLDATGDGTLSVAYSANDTIVERTGTLTLSALDGSSTVLTTNPSPVTTTLTQAAAARSIAFSSSSLSADAAAGTKDVTITSNSDWRVTTSDVLVTSLTFTPTTGNNTIAMPSGGSITLDATGDGTLVVAYSANGTIVERTGTLTLSAKNGENVLTTNPSPVTTTLTQAAAVRAIAFSSSSLSADAAAGTKDVTITSNSDFRVTTSDVLVTSLTFTPTTGNNTTATPSGGSITLDATGDGTLAVAYSENGTPAERTGTLTLSSLDGSSNVLTTNPSPVTTTLTQAAAARAIAFSSSSLSSDTAAGTKDVTITSNSDWRVTTSDVLVTSLTFTPTTGNNTTLRRQEVALLLMPQEMVLCRLLILQMTQLWNAQGRLLYRHWMVVQLC